MRVPGLAVRLVLKFPPDGEPAKGGDDGGGDEGVDFQRGHSSILPRTVLALRCSRTACVVHHRANTSQ